MGRPEWILLAVVLPIGLCGLVVAGGGMGTDSPHAEDELASIGVGPTAAGDGSSERQSATVPGEQQQFVDRQSRAAFQIQYSIVVSDVRTSAVWLLGGGAIGLLLVAVLVVARYGGVPTREIREDHAAASPAPTGASTSNTTEQSTGEESPGAESVVQRDEPPSDDRQVKRLLEDGGGRMKQTAIVEETEWSKSKVSMLLSEMEADGEIRKIQIGRENIIALEGHEPEAATSPFDDAE